MMLSELKAFSPGGKAAILQDIADNWDVAERAGINTPLRICHFMAQIAHESDSFRTAREYASGAAYEGRADLGNVKKGDGVRYRGRGLIQLTGRANYRAAGEALGIPLETTPTLAEGGRVIMQIAVWYWTSRRLNGYADKNDIRAVTKRINGGYNGLADRREKFRRAVEIWGERKVDVAGKPFIKSNAVKLAAPAAGLTMGAIADTAYQATTVVESGKAISESTGISFVTLGLLVLVLGLLAWIVYDRWFIRKYEGL
jgi:predicted chitinase